MQNQPQKKKETYTQLLLTQNHIKSLEKLNKLKPKRLVVSQKREEEKTKK